jgi:BirA family biotin operon repressor/biotin-[acetyl-CoA-carboxylase] ligase
MYNYENELKHKLGSLSFINDIIYYPSVDSTNTLAHKLAQNGYREWTIVVADSQNKGKGRQGRYWYSPPDVNIYTSFILKPDLSYRYIPSISLLSGMVIGQSIEYFTGFKVELKWPNDVMVKGKKISGVLLELGNLADGKPYVVVGIGINVNADVKYYPEHLSLTTTSMKALTNNLYDRADVLTYLYSLFQKWYTIYCINDGFDSIKKEYMERFNLLHKEIKIMDGVMEIDGIVKDIDKYGRLVLEDKKGILTYVNSGDVHLISKNER